MLTHKQSKTSIIIISIICLTPQMIAHHETPPTCLHTVGLHTGYKKDPAILSIFPGSRNFCDAAQFSRILGHFWIQTLIVVSCDC